MMKNVLKKSAAMAVLLGAFSLGSIPPLKAMSLGMGGSLIQTTPYDYKMNEAGVLATYFPAYRTETAENLFMRAKSIRYVSDSLSHDHWQSPSETEALWAGDCEDKAIWLYAQLKRSGFHDVRLVVGRYRSIDRGYHVWVTVADAQSGNLFLLDSTAQKRIWKSVDFSNKLYKPLFSFDGIDRYRHEE